MKDSYSLIVADEKNKCSFSSESSASQYYIGSLTKQITAYIIVSLLHQKYPTEEIDKLLSRKLSDEFSNSSLLKSIKASWSGEITILDLLTHRSGLSDYTKEIEKLGKSELFNKPIAIEAIFQHVNFDSKKEFNYSNTNYLLIARLIEEMTGASFDKVFDEMVKAPAKLENTYAPLVDNFHSLIKRTPFSKLVRDLNEKVFMDMANAVGTGNIISTSEDLLRWNKFLYAGIKKEIRVALLHSYCKDQDGDDVNLGLGSSQTNLGLFIGFQGGQDSYRSFLGYIPDINLNIVILCNNEADFEKVQKVIIEFINQDLTIENNKGQSLFFASSSSQPDSPKITIDSTERKPKNSL